MRLCDLKWEDRKGGWQEAIVGDVLVQRMDTIYWIVKKSDEKYQWYRFIDALSAQAILLELLNGDDE